VKTHSFLILWFYCKFFCCFWFYHQF